MKKRTVVFDLDGALETPYYREHHVPKAQAWMKSHQTGYVYEQMYVMIEACNEEMPHLIFPGTLELLRWVHDHGFDIVFFSNAVSERNAKLCPILMERAFGKDEIPPYRILSREDCVNTEYIGEEKQATYQGLWRGNYKKKLAGVVVPEVDVPETIMIEDDNSYASRYEERNFVYGVYGGCAADFLEEMQFSRHKGLDFHLPFYFCGILKRITDCAEREHVSLAEASVEIQYTAYGHKFPTDGIGYEMVKKSGVFIPEPPNREFKAYVEGLRELRQYNSCLRFWGAVDENANDWPKEC